MELRNLQPNVKRATVNNDIILVISALAFIFDKIKASDTITINASPEKVWKSLWDVENYKIWTSPFGEGSYYKTDSFSEGNKIQFLTPSGQGMYSILEKLDEPRFVALKHIGEIDNLKEQPFKDQEWTSAMETYELTSIEEGTRLTVHVDTMSNMLIP